MPLISPDTIQNSLPPKGKRSTALRRYIKLENDRSSWRSHWMELTDYLAPRRGRYLMENQSSRGRKRNNNIIDNTATQAMRTLGAGLMSGMTSPARPWFRFGTPDPDMMDRDDVKVYMSDVEAICRSILHKSNFYNTAYTVYTELGTFGTAPLYRQKSFDSVIRFRPLTAGEYVIAENHFGQVDTCGRNFTMTVAQIIGKFVMQPNGTFDWSGVSKATKKLWDEKNYDELVPVIHLIEPRHMSDRDTTKPDALNMPFKSLYFEEGAEGDDVLMESGYEQMPVYVPRWDVLSGEIYGRSPGMDCLGDIKQLQHQQKRKAQAIDKMVNPPMTAPTSLRGKPSTVIPGGTTYVDPTQGGQGFQPAYLVQPRLNEMMMDIQEVQNRIQRGFYADLFAMMINSDRRQMTATEVAERHEEKLVLLGPVLQRLNIELLDPLLDDVFSFAQEAGLLPEPPEVLADVDLRIEYISLLAQAQQAVGASAIERTMGFAGNMVAVFPDIVDNIDADKALRDYGEIVGIAPDMMIDSDTVEKARAARAEQQQQQQAMEQAGQAAQSAKVLSEADTQNPNALTDLLGGGQTV
tara:strand:- start:1861 stop:3594 length:1734 start_codon:yes stop_codon:yes gene_type:complete